MDSVVGSSGNYMYIQDYTVMRAIDSRAIDASGTLTFDPDDMPDGLMLTVQAGPDGTGIIIAFPGTGYILPSTHVYETKPSFYKTKEISAASGVGVGEVLAVWLDQ